MNTSHALPTIHHPSRGPGGSTYRTQDGKFYCRTRFGVRHITDPTVGLAVNQFQTVATRAIKRLWRGALYGFLLGVLAGIALVLLTQWGGLYGSR